MGWIDNLIIVYLIFYINVALQCWTSYSPCSPFLIKSTTSDALIMFIYFSTLIWSYYRITYTKQAKNVAEHNMSTITIWPPPLDVQFAPSLLSFFSRRSLCSSVLTSSDFFFRTLLLCTPPGVLVTHLHCPRRIYKIN